MQFTSRVSRYSSIQHTPDYIDTHAVSDDIPDILSSAFTLLLTSVTRSGNVFRLAAYAMRMQTFQGVHQIHHSDGVILGVLLEFSIFKFDILSPNIAVATVVQCSIHRRAT